VILRQEILRFRLKPILQLLGVSSKSKVKQTELVEEQFSSHIERAFYGFRLKFLDFTNG